jgi:hypothetical protein
MDGTCSPHGGDEKYKILVGKPEMKETLGRPRFSREHNVKLDHKETEWVWTGFIWLRTGTSGKCLVNTVMSYQVS